jgi:hypothetical protein
VNREYTLSQLNVSRRHFLAGAGALVAAPYFIPASALGKAGRPAPSKRLNVGFIGYGTMAHDNIGLRAGRTRVQWDP